MGTIGDVRFGSQADLNANITPTAASGGKADVLQLEISRHPQIRPRVSALLQSGRQIARNPLFSTSAFGQKRPFVAIVAGLRRWHRRTRRSLLACQQLGNLASSPGLRFP